MSDEPGFDRTASHNEDKYVCTSDIDRIAGQTFQYLLQLIVQRKVPEIEGVFRAALLEYGAIVREECAEVADVEAQQLFERQDERGSLNERAIFGHKGVTAKHIAAAIRNADKG